MTSAILLATLLALGAGADKAPTRVVHVGPVAADIIGITIAAGHVDYGRQVPYARQEGDKIVNPLHRFVERDGKIIGSLVGRKEDTLCTMDTLVADPLKGEVMTKSVTYAITSLDDKNFPRPRHPLLVYRKSKPSDLAMVSGSAFEAPVEHVIYLKLPCPLTIGKRYRIAFDSRLLASSTQLPAEEFVFNPERLRSEALHVSHLGFRPDDPAKIAFLSCWMGDGGGISYPEKLKFQVLEERGGRVVFSGEAVRRTETEPKKRYNFSLGWSVREMDETKAAPARDYNGADVFELNFSSLNRIGQYRVYVDGVGCSYPFKIAPDVWRNAFTVSARGFFHQRSGIELGPPYTTFKRRRPFHPDDGVRIVASTTPLMDTNNGLGGESTNFGNLLKGKTDIIVPNAWGGYMDAGDWDRRVQHLRVGMLLLELMEIFPDYFRPLNLNLPESRNAIPDIIDEALFNLDCYRRMQTGEGGIRGGIESSEHPRRGETSRQESLDVMAYAPDVFSSYFYAGVAARAAWALIYLGPSGDARAAIYRESALRAMEWAEKDLPRALKENLNTRHPAVRDVRNYAAAELYRLTGDARWHAIFLETTDFRQSVLSFRPMLWDSINQGDSAWVYARTWRPVDARVQALCRESIIAEADLRVASVERTAFRWSKSPAAPVGLGLLSSPEDSVVTVRAHVLTGKPEYLRAIVLASQTSAGANPINICYATGLGYKNPLHPLNIDARYSGQPAPPGLTVFGPVDLEGADFFAKNFAGPYFYPEHAKWPVLESYFDLFLDPVETEYTVQKPMAGTAYVWGYLAARTIAPDLRDVKYGPHTRNVLDVWKAPSDKPAPVLIFFHGGGFQVFKKELSEIQRTALEHGITAVSANYRYSTEKGVTIKEIMEDGARVIQFVRSKANEWNIDPRKVAVSGLSAGGIMALYLGLHDDLADPSSDDPIKRFSTRVTCLVGTVTPTNLQATFIWENIGGPRQVHMSYPEMFDLKPPDGWDSPKARALMDHYSAVTYITPDDPPVCLQYLSPPSPELIPETAAPHVYIHSSKFGVQFKEKMDRARVECVLSYMEPDDGKVLEFLLKQFRLKSRARN